MAAHGVHLLAIAALLSGPAACERGAKSPGQQLFETVCVRCHSLEVPLGKRKDAEGWRRTVWAMRQRGARLTDEQAEQVVAYLTGVRGL